jgi:hypothetical protein
MLMLEGILCIWLLCIALKCSADVVTQMICADMAGGGEQLEGAAGAMWCGVAAAVGY